TVPGPPRQEARQGTRQEAPADGVPHRIILGPGSGPDQWGNAFINSVKAAKDVDEVKAWDRENDAILQSLSEQFPGVYDLIDAAGQRRFMELNSDMTMPDPKAEAGAAMNWVAEKLAQLRTLQAAEAFWNETVAPREAEFQPEDWEMLLAEWRRTE